MRGLYLFLLLLLFPLAASADYAWEPLGWREGEVVKGDGKVKFAITLPIRINGQACTAQLDTGANGRANWHVAMDANTPRTTMVIEALGKTLQVSGPSTVLARIEDGKCQPGVIVSLGNGFFEDGTLLLDLLQDRVAFVAQSVLSNAMSAQPFNYAQWSQGDSGGGHVVVELQLPSGKMAYALLDSGAASFGLSAFSAADWSELTANAPLAASDAVREYSVNMWGKPIRCFRMAAPGTVVLGRTLTVPQFQASYCMQEAFKPGQKLVGLLGLRHLIGKVITLDYLARRWTIQ